MIHILAIPGSLRANSSSHAILKAAIALAPAGMQVKIFDGLGQLPHFDDSSTTPDTVTQFRKALSEADGVLICTPEYAFGIPGSLKNALDWTVSSAELMNKPVALITASSSGEKGHAALLLVLSALSAKIVENGTLLIPFVRARLTPEGTVSDPTLTESLRTIMRSLAQEVANEVPNG